LEGAGCHSKNRVKIYRQIQDCYDGKKNYSIQGRRENREWVSLGLVLQWREQQKQKEASLRKGFKDLQTALDEFPKWHDWKDNPNLILDWQSTFKAIFWSVKKEVFGAGSGEGDKKEPEK
jgi:hypothetical protein